MNHSTLLAVYHYCAAWHGGQASREYRVLSRVSRVFSPRGTEEYASVLGTEGYEDARALYISLVQSGQGEGESGYIECSCCASSIVADDAQAERGVTMCDDCKEEES